MSKHHSDFPAAVTGLLLGAVALLVISFTVVQLVNAKHAAVADHVSHN